MHLPPFGVFECAPRCSGSRLRKLSLDNTSTRMGDVRAQTFLASLLVAIGEKLLHVFLGCRPFGHFRRKDPELILHACFCDFLNSCIAILLFEEWALVLTIS